MSSTSTSSAAELPGAVWAGTPIAPPASAWALPGSGSWQTSPATAVPGPWAPLDETYEVSVVDDSAHALNDGTPLFAELSYRDALAVAARERAELPTPEQVKQIRDRGLTVPPVTLPDSAVRAAASRDPILARRSGEDLAAWDQRLRVAGMMSLAWTAHHDAVFWSRARALGGARGQLLGGTGKLWTKGARAGRAALFGWWDGTEWIQPEPMPGELGFHDDLHHDYATKTLLVRRRDGAPMGGGVSRGWALAAAGGAIAAIVTGWYLTTRSGTRRPTSARR